MTATLEQIRRTAHRKTNPVRLEVLDGAARTSPQICAAAAAANADAVAAPAAGTQTSLAALLAGRVLQDGELVLLILKPSIWFIPLSVLRFAAIVVILMVAAALYGDRLPGHTVSYVEAGIFVIAGRVMWAVLQWMNRLYVLTDLRILRLSGVFTVDVFTCPLRKVDRTRLTRTTRERLLRLGSIEIIPCGNDRSPAVWQTVARPLEVHDQVVAAINRAKQGGLPATNGK